MTRRKDANKALALVQQHSEPPEYTCSLDIDEPLDAPWQFRPNAADKIVQVSYEPPAIPGAPGKTRIWLLLASATLDAVLDEIL